MSLVSATLLISPPRRTASWNSAESNAIGVGEVPTKSYCVYFPFIVPTDHLLWQLCCGSSACSRLLRHGTRPSILFAAYSIIQGYTSGAIKVLYIAAQMVRKTRKSYASLSPHVLWVPTLLANLRGTRKIRDQMTWVRFSSALASQTCAKLR